MQTRHTIATGAAIVALAGGAAVAVPALAQAETASPTPSASSTSGTAERPSPMKTSLDKLVKAGTITQSQADKIIAQFEADRPQHGKGPGGPGPRGDHGPGGHAMMGPRGGEVLTAAAKTLGLTEDQLRTKLQTQSLGEIADAQKVSRQTLTDALQKAMTTDAATRAKELLDLQFDQRGPGRDDQRPDQQGRPNDQGPQDSGSTPSAPSAPGSAPSTSNTAFVTTL